MAHNAVFCLCFYIRAVKEQHVTVIKAASCAVWLHYMKNAAK